MRTVGIVFIVISALNILGWFFKSARDEPIGSPIYIIVVFGLLIGGIIMLNSKKKENETEN